VDAARDVGGERKQEVDLLRGQRRCARRQDECGNHQQASNGPAHDASKAWLPRRGFQGVASKAWLPRRGFQGVAAADLDLRRRYRLVSTITDLCRLAHESRRGCPSISVHVHCELAEAVGQKAVGPSGRAGSALYPASTRVAGNAISTSVPSFGALRMWKRARFASASALVRGRPRPVPPEPPRPEVASWRNGSSAPRRALSLKAPPVTRTPHHT